MMSLSLLACSFYLTEFNKSEDKIVDLNRKVEYISREKVNKFDDIKSAFLRFIEENKVLKDNKEQEKMFSCKLYKKGETEKYSYISFVVSSGKYGEKTNIKNKFGKVTHQKQAEEFEEREFLIVSLFPKSNGVAIVKGMLLFQNIGTHGVKTITTDYLREYFKIEAGLSFHTRNIAPDVFLDVLFKNGSVLDLILINNRVSDDSVDGFGYGQEQRIYSKLKIEDEFLTKLKKFAINKNNVFEFDEETYQKVKLKAFINNRQRIFDLHSIDMISTIDGIPDNCIDADGSVNFELVFEFLLDTAEKYLNKMVLNKL